MKTHKTIKITAKMLEGLRACSDGLERVSSLLPLEISTNPEENIRVAIKVAKASSFYDDTFWLMATLVSPSDAEADQDYWYDKDGADIGARSYDDTYIIAQRLAACADVLLSKRGR